MHLCHGDHRRSLIRLLDRHGLDLIGIGPGQPIPGSYWGEPEAGIIGQSVFARPDTPVHSVLHEACHVICMDSARRQGLHTDAGGDYPEENAVCYLQLVLADSLPGIGREALASDMDAWGYAFRLGSARAWFEHDADDARAWLIRHGMLTASGVPTWSIRAA